MGAWVYWRWWEPEGLDLMGARKRKAAAENREEERWKEEAEQE